MLNREIIPPDADNRYESFFDRAKQGTASSSLLPVRSLVISREQFLGCHNWGGTLVVAYIECLNKINSTTSKWSRTGKWKQKILGITWFFLTFPLKLRSFWGHFQMKWVAFEAKAKMALPALVYISLDICSGQRKSLW